MTPYSIARTQINVAEWVKGDNPQIIEYLKSCPSLPDDMENDQGTPWCAAFVNWCCKEAGIEGTRSAAARIWLTYGEKLKEPVPGCIVVLRRTNSPTSGHVCFFVKQSGDKILCLGGNQGDQVKESWYSTADVLGYRRLA